jgi:rhodanese-related sulfurtransferase
MGNIQDRIVDAKNNLPDVTPTPPGFKTQSSVKDLKSRLEWGEPALTIIDARDRDEFNQGHITGAMSMPMDILVDWASGSLDRVRDIYIYGANEEQTAQAAGMLREAGFQKVAELVGGLDAWKAVAGPTDGSLESRLEPSSESYTVTSQLKHHANTQKAVK